MAAMLQSIGTSGMGPRARSCGSFPVNAVPLLTRVSLQTSFSCLALAGPKAAGFAKPWGAAMATSNPDDLRE